MLALLSPLFAMLGLWSGADLEETAESWAMLALRVVVGLAVCGLAWGVLVYQLQRAGYFRAVGRMFKDIGDATGLTALVKALAGLFVFA